MFTITTKRLGLTLLITSVAFAQGQAPRLRTVHEFAGGAEGNSPTMRLVSDKAGVLYGTTANGGFSSVGSVFRLVPPVVAGAGWTFETIYSFGAAGDGQFPESGVTIDSSGNLYGTTFQGGAANLGTVYKLWRPAAGGPWTATVLYSFGAGTDGANPFGGVTFDSAGNLYGTTQQGGTRRCTARKLSCGTIFQLTQSPGGIWSEKILYNFSGAGDGAFPDSGLVADGAGNLYGTTQYGGSLNPRFGGSIFRLKPPAVAGDAWSFETLYDFLSTGQPSYYGDLVLDSTGAVYGTSWSGGRSGWGWVYKLTPPPAGSAAWQISTLWDFSGLSDGSIPMGGVVFAGGFLFGTTYSGGNTALCNAIGCGVIFRLAPAANGSWTETVVYKFQGGSDGATPQGGLLYKNGTLFGTTSAGASPAPGGGTVFSLR